MLNKSGVINYIVYGLMVIALAIAIIFVCGKGSEMLLEYTDAHYRDMFIADEPGFSAPWYEKGLHRVDEAFITTMMEFEDPEVQTLYVIGSSVSSNAIDKPTAETLGLNYKTLVCGNGCWRSNRILKNLGEKADIFSENDIVKYEVSFSTFRDNDYTITESVLDKWGRYKVKDDLTITEKPVILSPIYAINVDVIKIQNAWELLTSWWEQSNHPDRYPLPRGYANYKNNYFNYEAVAETCHFDEAYAESVIEDIDELNEHYNTLIEIEPIYQGLLGTEYGQQLDLYIDTELIPYLDKNGYSYRDLRGQYSDNDFIDGVHMNYASTIRYTRELAEYLKTNSR